MAPARPASALLPSPLCSGRSPLEPVPTAAFIATARPWLWIDATVRTPRILYPRPLANHVPPPPPALAQLSSAQSKLTS
jgi:hypothetical protein